MHTDAAAYEAAGRTFFRNLFGGNNTVAAEVFAVIGGRVAVRFNALGNWDAVELEGFEEAKHLAVQTDPDSINLFLLLCEIARKDPKAAYQSMWSSVVEIAQIDWPEIAELARSTRVTA